MNLQNKRSYLPKIKDTICLMLVLIGMFLCLSEFLKLEIPPVLQFCYIPGIPLLLLLLEEKRSWRKYVFSILAALGVWEFLKIAGRWEEIRQGFFGCLNQVIVILNQYYGMELEQIPWDKDPQLQSYFFQFFLIVIGIMEGLIWHFSKKKKGFCVRLLLPVSFIVGIVLAGKIPSFAGIILLTAGMAAGKLELDYRGAYGALAGIVLILGAASVFANSQRGQAFILELHDPWQKKQWEIEEKVWNCIKRYLPEEQNKRQEDIQLGNQKPVQNGRKIFEITLSEAPQSSVYLRRFVGGNYKDGTWQAVSEENFQNFAENHGYETADYAQWLAKQPYERAAKISKKPLNLKIKMAEEAAGYVLSPYYSRPSKQLVLSDDGMAYPMQQKEFDWEMYLNGAFDFSWYPVYQGHGNEEFSWEAYQQYVNANYKTIPGGLSRMMEFANEHLYSGKNLSEEIPKLLAGQAEYSLNLEPLPENSEFAEDFLFRQKKGYCVHFATAGTLLLRMCGVSARYVSGYCIPPEDFKENSDGTYTALVTDKRAHAWSEAFDAEGGFYPVEMTPEAATEGVEVPEQNLVEEKPKEPEQEFVQEQKPIQEQVNEQQKEMEKEKTTEEKTLEKVPSNGNQQEAEKTEQPGIAGAILRNIVRILVLTVLAAGVLIVYRRKTIKRRMARFHQEERSKAVLEIGKEVFRMLEISGFPRERTMTEQAYAQMLQEKIRVEGAQDWQHFVGILQKAAFSKQMLTEREWEEAWNLYQLLNKQLESRQNNWQKFWWKYWKRCS